MPKQTKKEKILTAALLLASDKAWEDVTVGEIAEKAGLSVEDYKEYFEDKMDLVGFWHHCLDNAMCSTSETFEPETETKDVLFDIFMARFDALNEKRQASLSILRSFKQAPEDTVFCLPFLSRSMLKIVKVAGLSFSGYKRAIVLSGLCFVYLKVMYVWLNDESPDMGRTMAVLDKTLNQAGSFSRYLCL